MSAAPRASAGVSGALGPEAWARLRDAAKVIAWGLVLYGGVLLVASKLQAKAFGSLALQMVLAEWGAGRLAVAWSDPNADPPAFGVIAARVGRGLGLGFAVIAAVACLGLATGGLSYHPNAPAGAQLGMGLATAFLVAARDELLLRGVVLRAFSRACPTLVLLVICGAVGVAAEYGALAGEGVPSPARLAVAGLSAVAFAALWRVDRGGFLPLGAHAAWTLGTGALVRGGLFDLRSAAGVWGGGDAGMLGAVVTGVGLLPAIVIAAAWAVRADRRR